MNGRFILEKQGHVMWLRFNRPERLNAMTIESWGELDDHLAAVDADRDVRCLVLAGEGRAFLAGHDAALEGSLEGALHFETEALVQTAMTRDNLEGARVLREARAEVHR